MKNTKNTKTTKIQSLASSTDNSKKKNNGKSNIPWLSEEVIFNILSWVSAAFLHNVIRFVSKSWGRIITSRHFAVRTHLSRSEYTLISESFNSQNLDAYFFDRSRVQMSRDWHLKLKSSQSIMDCRLGLVLLYDYSHPHLHLINPITKQNLRLPKSPANSSRPSSAKIAYVSHTGKIQIVCVYKNMRASSHCNILTVGNDMSWKVLNDTSDLHNLPWTLQSFPIGRFLFCWGIPDLNQNNRFWTLDLDDGSVHLVHCPLADSKVHRQIIPMGRALFIIYSSLSGEIVIWKLTDFRRDEWEEVLRSNDMSIESSWCEIVSMIMCKCLAWLENRKILAYSELKSSSTTFMVYDFIRRSSFCLLETDNFNSKLWIHTNSLVSF